MASTAAQDEAISETQEELAFQRVLLASIDDSVLNRDQAEQEIQEEIRALKQKLKALQRTGAGSSASQLHPHSQSSQPSPPATSVPGSWPTDLTTEAGPSRNRNSASVVSSSNMNRLPGMSCCIAFFCLH
jgi:hypothetical protein